MTDHLTRHADLFQRVAVHPSTNFPGRTQEGLLQQLLRKKLEPHVEEWVDEGRTVQATNEAEKEKDDEELWKWARDFIGERVAKYAIEEAGDNYTAAEREMGIENVKTGLRRKLDEDEDEDEEMEDVGVSNTTVTSNAGQVEFGMEEVKAGRKADGQARRLSDIMRYVTTGDPVRHYPSDRELMAKSNKSQDFSFS
jgi:mediator of RNA polymerase II transcription subunit 8, fungi type